MVPICNVLVKCFRSMLYNNDIQVLVSRMVLVEFHTPSVGTAVTQTVSATKCVDFVLVGVGVMVITGVTVV